MHTGSSGAREKVVGGRERERKRKRERERTMLPPPVRAPRDDDLI
jgi:hypothetical protein